MTTPYVLRGGLKGAERLQLLARVTWPTTQALLRQVGLKKGMRCLDVGCGAGLVTLKLAQWVGPAGQAVGIDFDEEALEVARRSASRLKHPPVFRAGHAHSFREKPTFDLVFSRFLLSHLTEPERGLRQLVRAARPGGLVVAEDVDFAGHFCYPPCPAFDRYVELYQQVVRRRGADPRLGLRLFEMFLDAGVESVQVQVFTPTFSHGDGKALTGATLEHLRESLTKESLASEKIIDALSAEIAAHTEDGRTIQSGPRIFQVWGRKPANAKTP